MIPISPILKNPPPSSKGYQVLRDEAHNKLQSAFDFCDRAVEDELLLTNPSLLTTLYGSELGNLMIAYWLRRQEELRNERERER